MTNTDTARVDEAIAEVARLAKTAVPKKGEVRQLYSDGDISRIGVLTADAIMTVPRQMADELRAMAAVFDENAKLLREEAETLIAEVERQAQRFRDEVIAVTEAAKASQDNIRATRAQMLRRLETLPVEVPQKEAGTKTQNVS